MFLYEESFWLREPRSDRTAPDCAQSYDLHLFLKAGVVIHQFATLTIYLDGEENIVGPIQFFIMDGVGLTQKAFFLMLPFAPLPESLRVRLVALQPWTVPLGSGSGISQYQLIRSEAEFLEIQAGRRCQTVDDSLLSAYWFDMFQRGREVTGLYNTGRLVL